MYTDDIHYVDGRLRHTVIRLKDGRPILCLGATDGGRGKGIFLVFKEVNETARGNEQTLPLSDFNLSSPILGNTNFEGSSSFIMRIPMRNDWRQGIRADNLGTTNKSKHERWRFPNLTPLLIPIKGEYPSYKECIDRVEDIYSSCAFSRCFSLDERGAVWYKERQQVGRDKKGVPELTEDFFWLKEALTEETSRDE